MVLYSLSLGALLCRVFALKQPLLPGGSSRLYGYNVPHNLTARRSEEALCPQVARLDYFPFKYIVHVSTPIGTKSVCFIAFVLVAQEGDRTSPMPRLPVSVRHTAVNEMPLHPSFDASLWEVPSS